MTSIRKITATARTTENAPALTSGAVSVWTGKTCINCYFVQFLMISVFAVFIY